MPSNLLGLAIFVTFLTPGICYSFRREGSAPVKKSSVIRETSRLVAVSLVSGASALLILTALSPLLPASMPDVRDLIRGGDDYFKEHSQAVAVGGLTFLGLACLLAVFMAAVFESFIDSRISKWPVVHWLFQTQVQSVPAWWLLFNENPETYTYVGCELGDGSYVGGLLYTFSPESDETADRELTLTGEITYRGPSDEAEAKVLEVGAVAISARNIRFLTVSYLSDAPVRSDEATSYPAASK